MRINIVWYVYVYVDVNVGVTNVHVRDSLSYTDSNSWPTKRICRFKFSVYGKIPYDACLVIHSFLFGNL